MRDVCYLYIIWTESGRYKIGISSDPFNRYSGMKSALSEQSKLVMAILLNTKKDAHELELRVHRALAPFRASGEWFTVPKSILATVLFECASDFTPARIHAPTPTTVVQTDAPEPIVKTREGFRLQCNCGHSWIYCGKSKIYASCPLCKSSVRVIKVIKGAKEA